MGEAAFRVLKHLGLQAGQTLLILGAGGSVGTIALQLAAARGINVIGTAAEQDIERLTALGAAASPGLACLSLAQAAQAHADLEARRNNGKIILLP